MLCDICKKREAVFHTKIVRNGVVRESHLCSECSAKYREDDSFSQTFGSVEDFFESMRAALGGGTPQRLVCRSCGTTAEEFLRTGYAGCPDCYKTLESVITPAIRDTQRDTRHVGKMPGGKASSAKVRDQIERLREQQQRAADSENYEEAGRIRDRINELIKSLGNGGDGNGQ